VELTVLDKKTVVSTLELLVSAVAIERV